MTAKILVGNRNLDHLLHHGVSGSSGLRQVPAKRGSDIEVGGRHGTVHQPGKRYAPAFCALPLWVLGSDPKTGEAPDEDWARLALESRLRELTRLVTAGELVTITHELSDGDARQIEGEVTDVMDWTVDGAGYGSIGQVTVGLLCHYPFWTDLHDSRAVFELAPGRGRVLHEFGRATAPMDRLILEIGQTNTFSEITQPKVNPQGFDTIFRYTGPIAAGRRIRVDTFDWSVTGITEGSSATWQPTGNPNQHIARVRHGNHPNLFQLLPQRDGPPRIVNTGTSTLFGEICGRQRHLVP